MAGLSAAHHLAAAGCAVQVFEKRAANGRPVLGGKAYSFAGQHGAAEHGFRFYPGFYQHVIETMQLIQTGNAGTGAPNTVADRLVGLRQAQIAADADPSGLTGTMTISAPSRRGAIKYAVPTLNVFAIGAGHASWLILRIGLLPLAQVVLDTNPNANGTAPKRDDDDVSWWNFCDAGNGSDAYKAFFAVGLTRCFVATRAEKMSARTGAEILLQLILDFGGLHGPDADRAFDRPTTEAWIDPWKTQLAAMGVKFRGEEVTRLNYDPKTKMIRSVTFGGKQFSSLDDVVIATSLEGSRALLGSDPNLVAADAEIARLVNPPAGSTLSSDAMNGIVFYPDAPLAGLIEGHYLLVESPWALTAIYQERGWWRGPSTLGPAPNGQLSVIISDWHSPGSPALANGRPAEACDDQTVASEVWRQLQQAVLPLANVARPARFTIDPARTPYAAGKIRPNTFPMLVNQTNAWAERPHAGLTGAVNNLVLAGDYVRATTDFASMETANETARRATRVLLRKQDVPLNKLPMVLDQLRAPSFIGDIRRSAGLLRRLARLLGKRLNDDGTLNQYSPHEFLTWFDDNNGFDPIDQLPTGTSPVSPGIYDDRWLPQALRLDGLALDDRLALYTPLMEWAKSLERVLTDLVTAGRLHDLIPVVDQVKTLIDFAENREQAFVGA